MVSEDRLAEALKLALELGKGRRFKQSVELVVVFKGADPKSSEVKFRDFVQLPRGSGKETKVLVIASGNLQLQAREAGVDVLAPEELKNLSKRDAKKLSRRYDVFLVQPDLMTQVGRVLGPALGPRGKFPIPIPAGANLKALVARYANSTRLRNKEQAWVGCRIGSEDMPLEHLVENAVAVLNFIKSKYAKPLETTAKIYFKTTMGPAVEVST
jgi:large subunit ribosomal protein L1